MTRRRAPGEGTVHKRKDGRYQAAKTYGYTQTGNPRRITAYGRTRAEAIRKLDERIEELGGPLRFALLASAARVTVGEWLDWWLRAREESGELKPRTIAGYRRLADVEIRPRIGDLRMTALRIVDVEDMLAAIAARGLARSTVRQVWQVLNAACRYAVRREVLRSNPCAEAAKPNAESGGGRVLAWEPAEVTSFLEAAKAQPRFFALYYLALTTGLRRGELLALALERDVDLDAAVVQVLETQSHISTADVTSAKTERSRRTIPLPADTVAVLREHVQRRTWLSSGKRWQDSGRLFTTDEGGPLSARYLVTAFKAAASAAGVRPLTFHGLRHTYASAALRAGVPLTVVSKRLGHADVAITLRVYAHVLADMEQAGALTLAELTRVDEA